MRETPLQNDRAKDILKDEPKKVALKMLYERSSHGGKDFGHKPTPVTIMNIGQYDEVGQAKALLRTTDTTKFITMKDLDSSDSKVVPQDFIRHIHVDERVPKMVKMVSKSASYVPARLEKVGPKWEPAP